MQSYIVLKGDTLYGISKQFGVSVDEIIKLNNITNNRIVVGEVLIIPSSETTFIHIVNKGDTLYSLSNKYGVSVTNIMRLNNLTSSNLSIGQSIYIPINDNEFNYYIVKLNDTLYSISKRFNTTVDSIKKLNNLSSNNLYIGQKLKVPLNEEESDELIYIVKKGDTLYSISKKYGISVNDLKELNNLNSNDLYVGQILKIDRIYNSSISVGSSCYGDDYVPIKYLYYTVRRGDNLYNIGKLYGVSVSDIMSLNNLTSSNLSVGQILKIKEI